MNIINLMPSEAEIDKMMRFQGWSIEETEIGNYLLPHPNSPLRTAYTVTKMLEGSYHDCLLYVPDYWNTAGKERKRFTIAHVELYDGKVIKWRRKLYQLFVSEDIEGVLKRATDTFLPEKTMWQGMEIGEQAAWFTGGIDESKAESNKWLNQFEPHPKFYGAHWSSPALCKEGKLLARCRECAQVVEGTRHDDRSYLFHCPKCSLTTDNPLCY